MAFDPVHNFRAQAESCAEFGSPFTCALLLRAADNWDVVGPLFEERAWHARDAISIRFAGALHAAVLMGRAPALAAEYPAAKRNWGTDAVWRQATRAIEADRAWFEAFLKHPPQTNETRRTICLLPAFLEAAAGGGPLHMLEVGASAGLNQNWDRFAYDAGAWRWGSADPGAPRVDTEWRGPAPRVAPVVVASRAACDAHPLDIRDAASRARLRAYVWADQVDRLERFDRAVALALANDTRVETEDAGKWLEKRLAGALPEGVTIVYHSIAWQYFSGETHAHAKAMIAAAAKRATPERRLAWVRYEHNKVLGLNEEGFSLDLTQWPGDGVPRRIAHVDPHARWVEMLA